MDKPPFSHHKLAKEPGDLPSKLDRLRDVADDTPIHPFANKWGRRHLELDGAELDAWCRRVWWGAAAGKLVLTYLYDQSRQDEAFDLITVDEWAAIQTDHAKGGVILAAAHIGPPKFAMCLAADRTKMPLIFSNAKQTPAWLLARGQFFDPRCPTQKTQAMIKAALHLRTGGLMFAAPDSGQSKDQIYIQAFNKQWSFAPGIAALARMMNVPSIATLALWEGNSLALRAVPIETPESSLGPAQWHNAWVSSYWNTIKPIVASSPENLRFLTNKIAREFGP